MNKRNIRAMTFDDLDEVLAVELKCFTTPWSRSAFQVEIEDNDLACYFVLTEAEQVIGYAGMWLILDEAHVTNIAVLSAFRGQGLGKQLLLTMIEHAKNKGAISMTLEVRVGNKVAKNLYTELGFEVRGVRPKYYSDTQEDALIMWRDEL